MTSRDNITRDIDDFFDLEKPDKWCFEGMARRIVHCHGALESFHECLEGQTANKKNSSLRSMKILVKRLADTGRLSNENFPKEGYLPSLQGKPAKPFWALKRIPIRGYLWMSELRHGSYYISHYIVKRKDKLANRDTNRISDSWRRVEEQGDER